MRQNCAQHQANFPVEVFCFWWLDVYKGKFKKIKERSKNPDFTCLERCIGSVRRRRKQTGRKTKGEGWLPGVRKKDKVREPAKATVVV